MMVHQNGTAAAESPVRLAERVALTNELLGLILVVLVVLALLLVAQANAPF